MRNLYEDKLLIATFNLYMYRSGTNYCVVAVKYFSCKYLMIQGCLVDCCFNSGQNRFLLTKIDIFLLRFQSSIVEHSFVTFAQSSLESKTHWIEILKLLEIKQTAP